MRVTLRKEKIAKGRQSLYLDVYIEKGNAYQKRLGMYLEPATSYSNKEKNKQTLRLAEIVKNKLEYDILNKKHGQHDPRQDYNFSFIEYYDKLVAHRNETQVNYFTWLSTQRHLHRYSKKTLRFEEVTETWMEGFRSYLLSKVSQNSAHSYFNILKRAVHTAFRDKLLDQDPANLVKSPKIVGTRREYLTQEELLALKDHECRYPILKQAFFFSCLTGVRWSDIQKLKWHEVADEGDRSYLVFTQKKTKEAEKLPINSEARKMLGERGEDDSRVFVGLQYSAWHNVAISQWMIKAGIKKHITFHCARHTHATLLINKGVDLFTVSKLLGHKELRTTQVYAKLVNETKIEAVDKLLSIY